MIRLFKGPQPDVLAANAEEWTSDLLSKRELGLEPTKAELNRYNDPDVKAALKEETGYKCAYCESKFLHVDFGDIEHIVPKSLDDALRFEWSNLTLACGRCNQRKAAHIGLIDPYRDDPEDYLRFLGDIVVAVGDIDIGYRTLLILDLNRDQLRERRYERIKYIEGLIRLYFRERGTDIAELIRADFISQELNDRTEYAAMVRQYVVERAPEMLTEH